MKDLPFLLEPSKAALSIHTPSLHIRLPCRPQTHLFYASTHDTYSQEAGTWSGIVLFLIRHLLHLLSETFAALDGGVYSLLALGACFQDLGASVKCNCIILSPFPVFLWHAQLVLPLQGSKGVTRAPLVE